MKICEVNLSPFSDYSVQLNKVKFSWLESLLNVLYPLQTVDKLAPYIEEVYPGFVLATGGCGYAAKGSDEIGRIAAKLCTKGEWTCPEISQNDTKIKWRTRQNKEWFGIDNLKTNYF